VVISRSQSGDENHIALTPILSLLDDIRNNRPSEVIPLGKPPKTKETIQKILTATKTVFTKYGHTGSSLRKVADEAGMAVGNLTYHFPTKHALLKAMMAEYAADYIGQHLEQFDPARDKPLIILLNLFEFYVSHARQSHRFVYQMWSYAGWNQDTKATVRELYRPIGRFVHQLIQATDPDLNDTQLRQRTLQLFSLAEGYKLFIGMGPTDSPTLKTAEADIRILVERIVCGR